MVIVQRLKHFFKLKNIEKKLKSLDKNYYAIVWKQWKEKGYAKSTECFPLSNTKDKNKCYVPLSVGINLVIMNKDKLKNIFLVHFTKNDEDIVRKYVELKGFSTKNIDSDPI